MVEGNPVLSRVAERALQWVQSGMVVGLGTGRAASAFIERLGAAVRAGDLDVTGVPTSEVSARLAEAQGIALCAPEDVERIDVAFDGADEVSPDLDLTKGLGGALLRERVVAAHARTFVVLVTPEKLVEKLASRCAVPVEVVPFALGMAIRKIRDLGGRPTTRTTASGATYLTDNGNPILDVALEPLSAPGEAHRRLRDIPGVVDTGLFVDMAHHVLVGRSDGVSEMRRG